MPMMCEECKCSNWYCKECGESNHHDCDCSCCGCKCQTQPNNQTGEQPEMTMINPTPNDKPIDVPFTIKIADMNEAQAYTERQNAALQELIEKKDDYIIRLQNEVSSKTKAQQIITDIVKDINENIKELSLTEDDSFPLDTLKEIFEERGYDLDFKRLYKVEVVYTVKAQIEIEAEDADAAKEEVESDVSLIDISIDGNLIDWDVIDESVNSAEEA